MWHCSAFKSNLLQHVRFVPLIPESQERFCMWQFVMSFPPLKAYRAIAKLTLHLQKNPNYECLSMLVAL